MTDHPIITKWLNDAYKVRPGGIVVVHSECAVTLKNGRTYGIWMPPPNVLPHLRRNGTVTYGDRVVPSFVSI